MQEERDSLVVRRFVPMISKLILAQALWLLSLPAQSAGLEDTQQASSASFEQGSDLGLLALSGMMEWKPEDDYVQQLPPAIAPLTLAQANTAPVVSGNAPMWRFGITGIVNTITFHRGRDAESDPVSYSIINPPFAGITQDATSPWVFRFPANKAVGVYTVTVRWSDDQGNDNTKAMRYGVLEPATMGEWKLDARGRPRFMLTGGAVCATGSNMFGGTGDNTDINTEFGSWIRAAQFIKLDIKYNDGASQSTGFENFWGGMGCDNPDVDYSTPSIPIGSNGENVVVPISAQLKNMVLSVPSVLATGSHNYKIKYSIRGSDQGGSQNTDRWVDRVYYVSEELDVTYVKSKAKLAVPVVAADTAAQGHKLGTLSLGKAVPGASWMVEGAPALSINLVPVSGSETSKVELRLGAAAALKATNPVFTMTISAVGMTMDVQHFHSWTELEVTIGLPPSGIDVVRTTSVGDSSRRSTLPVKLLTRPAGGVTLELSSANAAHVTFTPAQMVFDGNNWDTAQDAVVQLTEAGAAVSGNRSVDVQIAIGDATAAANYASVAAATISVGVFVPVPETLNNLMVTLRSIAQNFTRVPSSPTGAGVTYEAMVIDSEGDFQDLPGWLTVAPSSGRFTVQPYRAEPYSTYQLRVFAVQGGARVAAGDFQLYLGTAPRLLQVTDEGTRNGISNISSFWVDMGAPLTAASYEEDEFGEHDCPDATVISSPDTVGDCVFPTAGNPRVIQFGINRNHRTALEFNVTLHGTSAYGDHEFELTLQFTFNPGGLQARSLPPTWSDDSIEDIIVEYPADAMLSDNDPMVAVTVSAHPRGVRIFSDCCPSNSFQLETGSSRSNDRGATVTVTKDGAGAVFARGVDEYRFVLEASPGGVAASSYRNLIIRKAAEVVLPTALTVAIDESVGTDTTEYASGEVLATISATSTATPISYAITDGAGSTFAVNASSGVISLAEATNFNFEKKSSHTITLRATDSNSDTEDFALVVNINNVVENPGIYTNVMLTVTALSHAAITVAWKNTDFHAQFDPEDRGAISLEAYNSSTYNTTVSLGTEGFTWFAYIDNDSTFTVELSFYSKDGSRGTSTQTYVLPSTPANRPPALTAPGTVTFIEAEDSMTAAGTELATLVAVDPDMFDVVAYSIRNTLSSDDGRFFGVDTVTGVITLSANRQLRSPTKSSYTLNVRADDTANTAPNIVHQRVDGNLVITVVASPPVGVDVASAASVSDGSRTATLPVKLLSEPDGGVTLALSSENDDHVTFTPAQLVFDGNNWETAQDAMVRLTDAGAGVRGNRSVEVQIAIDDATDAANYASADPATIAVAVSVPNQKAVFTAASLTPMLNENFGSAEMTAVGVTVAKLAATDGDNDPLTFSLRDELLDGARFGVAANGDVTVKMATNFNNEEKANYTINVQVTDGAFGGAVDGQMVLSIVDIDEKPVFAADSFPTQIINPTAGGNFTFHAATDPDNPSDTSAITYAAALINPAQALPHGGLSFVASTRVFTVAANSSSATLTVRVTASDGDTTAEESTQDFVVLIANVGIDVVRAASVSESSRTATLPVKLLSEPDGGVTLALSSENAAHVTFTPAQLVFDGNNWETAQNAVVGLTDAGAGVGGDRNVNVQIAIGDAAAAANYASVAPVQISVAVSVPEPAEALTNLMVTLRSIAQTFTRVPSSPTGAGVTYEAMVVDGEGNLQDLPGWLTVASSSGRFTVQPYRAEPYTTYQLRVFAVQGGERAAAGDFQLYLGTAPRLLQVTDEGTRNGISNISSFWVDMGAPLTAASYEEDEFGEHDCPDATVISSPDTVGDCVFPTAGNPRVIQFGINRNHRTALEFNVTLHGTSAYGDHEFELTLQFTFNPPPGGLQARSLPPTWSDNSIDDIIVEYPADAMLSDNDPMVTVTVSAHPRGVRIFSDCCPSNSFQLVTGSSRSNDRGATVTVTKDGAGAVFAPGVDEYRFVLNASPGGVAASSYRNLIIRKAEEVPQTAVTVSIDENDGKGTYDAGEVLATVSGASTDTPISYAITEGAGSTFQVGSSNGEVSLAEATNFNFERKVSHTVVVRARDANGAAEDFELVINLNNVVENPGTYTNVNFQASALAHNAITISWSNTDFTDQFESFDQGWIVLTINDNVGAFPKLTLGVNATVTSWLPLGQGTRTYNEGDEVTVFLRFFSKDGSSGTSVQQAAMFRMPANNAPVFAATVPATVTIIEATGSQTATSTELVTLAATDADPFDVVAYSIRNTGDAQDGRFFGVDAATGVITLKAAMALVGATKSRYTIEVRASDSATPNIYSSRSVDDSIVVAAMPPPPPGIDVASAASVSDSSRTATLPVKLLTEPDGGVTLALSSENEPHVTFTPAQLVFDGNNWETAQDAVVRLTDAGAGVRGNRSVNVQIAVNDATDAANYVSIDPATIAVAVSVPNQKAVFTAASLTPMINENFGSAEMTAVGVTVAKLAATDGDNDPLTFSLRDELLDGARFGVAANGDVTVKMATNFNNEEKANYTINVQVTDGAFGGAVDGQMVLSIVDIDEKPVFAADSFPTQIINPTAGGNFTFHMATDPDNPSDTSAITYTAALINPSQTLPHGGLSFAAGTRIFTVGANSSAATLTVRVTASDGDTTAEESMQDFVVLIADVGIDVARAASVSDSSRSATVPVKLISPPVGGGGLTLALSSANAAHVTFTPAQLVFDGDNWSTAQDALVRLTDDGEAVRGDRSVNVQVAIGDATDAANYASVDPATIAVAVSVPNQKAVFTAASLTPMIDENFGSAEMTAVGVTVAKLAATDGDSDPLTFSLRDQLLDGARFGVAANGDVTVKVATNFNNEEKANYTINVQVTDGAFGGAVDGQMVLSIDDIDEKPVFAAASFPTQVINPTAGGNFTFHAATDPDDPTNTSAITYTAALINPAQALPHGGLSFAAGTRIFTVAANSSSATLTVRVTASDGDTTAEESTQDFVVLIADVGIDVARAASVSDSSRSATVPVRLLSPPDGGLTLALSSANAPHVTFTPAQLVFDGDNWSTAQNAVVRLIDDGVAVRGDRSVNVQVAIGDATDAANYASIDPVVIAVAVSVPNQKAVFTASSLTPMIDENFGSAEMTAVGVTVAKLAATDGDSDPLTFSLRDQLLDGARFGVAANGDVTVKVATNFNNEDKDKYTLNVQVTDGAFGGAVDGQMVLSIVDIDEKPVFAAASFPTQVINPTAGGTITFHAATDPDDPTNTSAITYTAALINPAQALPHGGLSFVASTQMFTVAPNSDQATLTVRVTASDGDTTAEESVQDFVVLITDVGIDVVRSASVSKSTRSAVVPVKLISPPVGGGGVTLALSSADDTQVTFTPAQLVFDGNNWGTAQNATVSLLQAGVEVKGDRNVQVQVAVSDASGTSNYGSVAAIAVAVAVSVPNDAPLFDADTQRSRSIDEGVYQAGDPVGAPVVASDADNDPGELSYSLMGTSALFEVDADSGQLSFKAATDLDHEDTASYQVTLNAADGETAAAGIVPGEATVTVAIMVTDVNEAPVLAALTAQVAVEGYASSYQVAAASDPEGDDLTYTAFRVVGGNQSSLPAGVSFDGDPGVRTFTFADTLSEGDEFTLRVVASDGSLSAQRDFVLRVLAGVIIVGPQSVPLSSVNREAVFQVRLGIQPQAAAVTLTLASRAAADVAVRPVTLEFDRSDWNVFQLVTVQLLDAALATKGERQVQLSIGVFSSTRSDVRFRSVPAHLPAVQIANVNAAPVFSFAGDPLATAALGLVINESVGRAQLAADTDVGSPITAVDADNPTGLIYSLVGGDGSFRIGVSDGQLVAVAGANFNHEAASRRTVVVQASDGEPASPGVETGLATVTVTVRINDIDEKPLDYTGANFRVVGSNRTETEVTLGWSNSEYTRQFAQVDRGSIQVSYGVGGFAHTVSVSSEENRVRLVDLVPGVSYAATLHWFSADGISQDTPVVLAAVTAGANDAPSFDDLTYSRPENSGREQTASGTAIVTLVARDRQSDAIFYSMRSGSDAGLFAVDAQSGVVRLVRSVNFDHEGKASYTFAVAARDEYGAATVGNVVLAISDVVESPMLPEQFAQVATVGFATTIMLRPASDPESESRTIVYQAEQINGAVLPPWLEFNQATGELTVGMSAIPGTLTLRVQAVVASPGSSLRALAGGGAVAFNEPEVVNERVFKLAVATAGSTNSRPDFASATTDFNLAEGEYASGRSLGTVVAQDSDSLSYELRGADAAPFAINRRSGALSVREGAEFDHEGQEIYRFLVDADDGNGGLSSAEVVVQIGDVNEAPQFPAAAQSTYQVAARAMISFFVVPAFDQDGDRVTYRSSSPGSWLSFDADTLAFTVQEDAPLGNHAVTLVVRDAGGRRAQQVLQINVAGVGNSAPSFASAMMQMGYTIPRRQDAVESGTGIGSIRATDADSDTLVYRIVPGDDADLFEVDEISGRIVVAAGEELAARERPYRFTAEVDDGRGGIATVVVEVTVREDVQEAGDDDQDQVVVLAIDRAVAVAAIDLIQARLNAPTPPSGGADLAELADQSAPYLQMASAQQQWDDWRYEDEHDTDAGERMTWRDFLHSGGFDFALDGSQSRGPQGRIWGAASRASMDGEPLKGSSGLVFYDGKINMVMMGAEYRTSSKRFGVAFGTSNTDLLVGELKTIAVERKLNVVYPYLSLPLSERARMWVSAGLGSGEYMRGANTENATKTARDTDYLSIASGVEGNWSHELVEIDSGVKALVVRSKMDELAGSPEATGRAWRLQADFKASSSFAATSGIDLRPFVGAHLYHDGGDEWLGTNALDTSAGMNLKWDRGLQAEFSSRWNVNDDGDVNEERIDASISYDYGFDGRGLLLTVAPRMSNSSAAEADRSLSGSASYGLPVRLFTDSGMVTFTADFATAKQGVVAERYGFRFAGRRLDVDLGADGDGDSWRIDLKLR